MKYPRYFPYQGREIAFQAIQAAPELPGNRFPHEPMGKHTHAFGDGFSNKQATMTEIVIIFIILYFLYKKYFLEKRQTIRIQPDATLL